MKSQRHAKITEIINKYEIESQTKLGKFLENSGFKVTQATISRDIRELNIIKVTTSNGIQKYSSDTLTNIQPNRRLKQVFIDCVTSVDFSKNIVVIKTLPGMAMAVAAVLDSMQNDNIMGTIAGDDTIFCAIKTEEKAIQLINMLKSI